VPANLPREIVDRLNAEVVKILHASDLQARFAREAIDTKSLDADAFTAYFKAESGALDAACALGRRSGESWWRRAVNTRRLFVAGWLVTTQPLGRPCDGRSRLDSSRQDLQQVPYLQAV
jgi:hypothetical protein